MDSQKIDELLDKSCADALVAWCQERTIFRPEASEAMTALGGELKKLIKPDYDCNYIPPAYIIRYQLGHIYMAWKVLSTLERLWHRDSLRIVDFGAGASAGRIGAALMVAEAIEDGRSINRIYFDEIDISAPMQEMGELVWQAFTQEVRRKFANTALACAVNIIESRQHRGWEKVKADGCETWLTAFHVINQDSYALPEIETLHKEVEPIAGAFSCYKGNLEDMRKIFPFCQVYESDSGYFPHYEGKVDGKVQCPTAHISNRAVNYGFITDGEHQRNLRPFLQVKDCAILLGSNIPF